jgi:ABC-2 type transport system ATP-binding protein
MADGAPAGAALAFERVCKRYRSREVLDGLTLTVRAGECFGLVGMNGAGKTTCIKALLDFHRVDAGAINVFGVPHTRTASRARLAFLPERFMPPYYLTGRDFLAYAARLQGNEPDARAAAAMCEELDLDPEALARPVREYSKGMAQKLGLVACFRSGRELLVLDEPMSGLDPKARLLVKRPPTSPSSVIEWACCTRGACASSARPTSAPTPSPARVSKRRI